MLHYWWKWKPGTVDGQRKEKIIQVIVYCLWRILTKTEMAFKNQMGQSFGARILNLSLNHMKGTSEGNFLNFFWILNGFQSEQETAPKFKPARPAFWTAQNPASSKIRSEVRWNQMTQSELGTKWKVWIFQGSHLSHKFVWVQAVTLKVSNLDWKEKLFIESITFQSSIFQCKQFETAHKNKDLRLTSEALRLRPRVLKFWTFLLDQAHQQIMVIETSRLPSVSHARFSRFLQNQNLLAPMNRSNDDGWNFLKKHSQNMQTKSLLAEAEVVTLSSSGPGWSGSTWWQWRIPTLIEKEKTHRPNKHHFIEWITRQFQSSSFRADNLKRWNGTQEQRLEAEAVVPVLPSGSGSAAKAGDWNVSLAGGWHHRPPPHPTPT